jgi:crossover junction endodeoxyribonuclease RusA
MAPRPGIVAAMPGRPTPPVFEFHVQGPAISARAKNRLLLRSWTERVTAAAQAAWPAGKSAIASDLDVYISEFSEVATRDRDNMAKPVLDAMQKVVYENDRQVKRLHVEWCDIEGSYVVRFMSPIVAGALSVGKEFLWVRVFPHAQREDLVR